MAATNVKTTRSHVYESEVKLADGFGTRAAKQPNETALRRLVLTCLLWEDNAYLSGSGAVEQIKELVHKVSAEFVAALAVEARALQKLRHVPLLLCRELARHAGNRATLAQTMEQVIRRPDEMAEFLSLYWKDNLASIGDEAATVAKKKTLSAQVKKGLAAAFRKFDAYQLAKWDRGGKEISLRDVLFLCHAKPKNAEQDALWKRLIEGKLATPDTWEVGLSAAKTNEEKRAVWERLITERKLGSFAFLKNLRHMRLAEVPIEMITGGLSNLKPDALLPLDFLKAVGFAPELKVELEQTMYRCAGTYPKLPGWSVFVIDVSGSMQQKLSGKSDFNRLDAGLALAVLAAEMCEHITIYATAGNDGTRIHQTERLKPLRGFALVQEVMNAANRLGGGGIFTRQCLEYIREHEDGQPDRIAVFSDSQDCDSDTAKLPKPFGKRNYICDVSSHKHGVNYAGLWDAEISGWSGAFLTFIAECEREILLN